MCNLGIGKRKKSSNNEVFLYDDTVGHNILNNDIKVKNGQLQHARHSDGISFKDPC